MLSPPVATVPPMRESWELSPLEAALARTIKALLDKCEAAAKPHQQRADAERAPARAQAGELVRLLADARGIAPERVLAVHTFPTETASALEVELLPLPGKATP